MALRVNILQCWGRPGLARLILHGKYHTCWWPGVERSQSISSLSVDPVNSPRIFHHLYHKINIVLMRQFNLVQTFQRTYNSSIKLPHPINLVLTLSDDILDCGHLTSKHYLMRWSTIHFWYDSSDFFIKALRPRQKGCHFEADIFWWILTYENCCIFIQISLNNPSLIHNGLVPIR